MDEHWWRGVTALSIFVAIGTFTGVSWAPFSSVPKLSRDIYGMSDADLAWQQNATNICQGLLTPFAAWLLAVSHRGLSISLKAAAMLLAIQCGLFAAVLLRGPDIRGWNQLLAMAGSVVGGSLAALFQGATSDLSARYFESDRSRARSTSIGYAGQYIGVCGAQLWFREIDTEAQFRTCLLICLGVAIALASTTLLFFPAPLSRHNAGNVNNEEEPLLHAKSPPEVEMLSFGQGIRICARSPTVVLLALIAGVSQGFAFSWQATLPMTFDDLGSGMKGERLGYHFTGDDGNILSFATLLAYTVSSTISGDISERFFHQQHRHYLLCVLSLSFLSVGFLWVLIPSSISPSVPLLTSWLADKTTCYWVVFATITVIGLTTGLVVPPALELLAEASFPAPAGTTANAVMFLTEIMCIPLTAIIPMVPASTALPATTLMVLVALGVCFLLALPVKNSYLRRIAQGHVTTPA
eukprot:m.59627 g.59627  ORF g.59627 m.59627 type:complete len:467 (+) comp9471_c0_seq2:96-1496(+)